MVDIQATPKLSWCLGNPVDRRRASWRSEWRGQLIHLSNLPISINVWYSDEKQYMLSAINVLSWSPVKQKLLCWDKLLARALKQSHGWERSVPANSRRKTRVQVAHPGTEERSRHPSCSLLSDSRWTLCCLAEAACNNKRALTRVVLVQYKLWALSPLSKELIFSWIGASYLGSNVSLAYSSCKPQSSGTHFCLCSGSADYSRLCCLTTLFSSCIPIKCRTFVLLCTTVLSGTNVSWCTWHLKKEGSTNFHRNWRNHSRERKDFSHISYTRVALQWACKAPGTRSPRLIRCWGAWWQCRNSGNLTRTDIFASDPFSQWNHFEQEDSFFQSEEIGTFTPATIYFISVLPIMKGTIFLTVCLTERHILCVEQFQRANGKVHITSPAVKAFVNIIIIIKEA